MEYSIEKRIKSLVKEADKYFPEIHPGVRNSVLLKRALNQEGISTQIVRHLEIIEQNGELWGQDAQFHRWFENFTTSVPIPSPVDPVNKLRWLSLLAIGSAIKEQYSYGNVVIPPDYLPENTRDFKKYEEVYGDSVLEDIITMRNNLRRRK